MPLIPSLQTQRQEDLCKTKANLIDRVSSKSAKATQRNPVSENQKLQTLCKIFWH